MLPCSSSTYLPTSPERSVLSTPPRTPSRSSAKIPTIAPLEHSPQDNALAWYGDILAAADLVDNSPTKGCYVIKPLATGMWNQINAIFRNIFQAEDCGEEYMFPMMIPVELMEKEATHVKGFASESLIATHHRLIQSENGKMIPDPTSALSKPLIIRPTSETIIGWSMNRWVNFEKDLPLKIIQFANVFRWEGDRTQAFLRTMEFFWHEGHTAHSTSKEAHETVMKMMRIYEMFMNEYCALPVLVGEKPPGERFAGAEKTFCLEAILRNGHSLQAGTSHYLGDHFANAADIKFRSRKQETGEDGKLKWNTAYTTSWGISTRIIGGMIMTHSDEYGLRIPPRISPYHVVIIPAGRTETPERSHYINRIKNLFHGAFFFETDPVKVYVDNRPEISSLKKAEDWYRKGVPATIIAGAFDVKTDKADVYFRINPFGHKDRTPLNEIRNLVINCLEMTQHHYLNVASQNRDAMLNTHITTFMNLRAFFENPANKGCVKAPWFVDIDTEKKLKGLGVTIRCLPFEELEDPQPCILTGRMTRKTAIFGRAY